MRVFIIGGSGMLGHKLVQILGQKFDVWTTVRADLESYKKYPIYRYEKTIEDVNVENIISVERAIEKIKPEVVINATGVIKQISSAQSVIKVLSINSIFPNQLVELAGKFQFRLITISTDCVFSGTKGNYSETDIPDAQDLYGKSKQFGEIIGDNCLTLRTSIIGRELKTSHSLVEWFLSNRGGRVKGFKNAIFSGFPTVVLADIISNLIENFSEIQGLYHVSSEPISKFDLLNLIKQIYKVEIEIEPFEDFKIDRSLDSTKFRDITGFKPMDWQYMIRKMFEDNGLYES